jgi:hypothetical protein
MKEAAVCIVVSTLLVSCAMTPSPALQAKQAELEQTIPVCIDEQDCKAKWEAAQIWIVRNSSYRIQTATDVLLHTYNPRRYDSKIAVQVTKEPQGGGKYRFLVNVYCDNVFGCVPNALDAALDFNRFVGSAKP